MGGDGKSQQEQRALQILGVWGWQKLKIDQKTMGEIKQTILFVTNHISVMARGDICRFHHFSIFWFCIGATVCSVGFWGFRL